jgi:hypothetical protein
VVNKSDQVFVADLNNKRMQEFDVEGRFLAAVDIPGGRAVP